LNTYSLHEQDFIRSGVLDLTRPCSYRSGEPSNSAVQVVQVADNWCKEFDSHSTHIGLAVSDIGSTVVTGLGSHPVTWNIETGDKMDTITQGTELNGMNSLIGIGLSNDGKTIISVSSSKSSRHHVVCAINTSILFKY